MYYICYMAKKIVFDEKEEPMKVFTYRMPEDEQAAADAECRKTYKIPLATFLRTLIKNHFPTVRNPQRVQVKGKK